MTVVKRRSPHWVAHSKKMQSPLEDMEKDGDSCDDDQVDEQLESSPGDSN
jgi:hypothetical protein